MTTEEKRYRVTAEYKSVYQIVIEAVSPEEAEYFAKDIDLDKWQYIEGDLEVVDISKDFFLKRVRDEQILTMNKIRLSLLSFVFLAAFFLPEPNFIYENFWSKANFWDALPFTPSIYLYKFLYAFISTGIIELLIRFTKRYL